MYIMFMYPQRVDTVKVKISGDGARFSSFSSFLPLSFSLPSSSENILSSAGTYMYI